MWSLASAGSKGDRSYAWAWLATASPRHFLLVRRSLTKPNELAYFYCWVPPGHPAHPGRRSWPPLDRRRRHEFGKDLSGYDLSQVRLYTALHRHLALVDRECPGRLRHRRRGRP